jgi:tRNA (guanine37-N1)-methyltransferase
VRIDVITLFPEILRGGVDESILGRAQARGLAEVRLHQLRDYALDKHHIVDDKPYGGGPGMLLKCEPLFRAIEAVRAMHADPGRVILLSASGRLFRQSLAREWADAAGRLILVCGHYEGVDDRVREHLADEEVSIGDYVLTNGAVAALVLVDAIVRLLPDAVGNEQSTADESFSQGLIEAPQYTRPEEFRGWRVPEVLLSGHHGKIAAWRHQMSLEKTRALRPDLLPTLSPPAHPQDPEPS